MHTFVAELHVHTVLSPCAEVEMIPPLIVQAALERGIHLIAVTDHNASANVAAVQRAAIGTALHVLPGMEVQTQEEVHLLCLFDTLGQLAAWQTCVDQALPPLRNNPAYFGEQFVVDETGDFIRREEQLLLTSAGLSLTAAFHQVTALGGLAIPAHVDRKANGLLAVLGFVPLDLPFAALEISRRLTPQQARLAYAQLQAYPLVQSGDVHRLDEYLGANEFRLQAPTIAELRHALQGTAGRSYRNRLDNLQGIK